MDLKVELQNFKMIDLDNIVQTQGQLPDKVRNSIFLYNKAIDSLKSGSEDIAIIELKKATAMNPQFYEAWNLLGICYSYSGDSEKAAETFNKVIQAESNSILAMNYMQRLGLSESVTPQKSRQEKQPAPQPGEPLKRIRTNKSAAPVNRVKKQLPANMAKIGAGFAAGLLLAFIIYSFLPKNEPNPPVQNPGTADTALSDLQAKYDADYSQWKGKYDLLQKDKDSAMQQADYYKATLKLYEIDILARDKKYEEAADNLLLLKTVDYKEPERKRFDALYESVMPQAAKAVYDEGYKLYNSRRYQDSLKKLEKVQIYDPQYKRMDAVLYYTGRCCQMLQDSRSAVALFQKLIDSYPNSTYARNAKARISELTQKP
ncbi:MAG: tetratricopeptide repeat protein [Clostridiaceae bacterium]